MNNYKNGSIFLPSSRRKFLSSTAEGAAAALALSMASVWPAGGAQAQSAGANARYAGYRDELERHSISAIERRVVQNRWPRLVGKNSRLDVHGWGRDSAILVIHCDSGASGFGYAPGVTEEQATALAQEHRGKRLTEVFDPATGRRGGVVKQLDFALHDLAGVILNLPVYEMISGNSVPLRVPLYSGMIYFDDLEPFDQQPGIDQVLFNAGADHAYGYRQMKIKVGRGSMWMPRDEGLERDIQVTRALAEAYPDVEFLADANDGFTVQETLDYLEGIGDVELFFLEEPFKENVEGFSTLRNYLDSVGSKTLIADGEFQPDQEQLDDLISRGLLDLHLTDVYGLGFTEWRALMPTLQARGVVASPHNWGARLKTVYTSHLASGLGNVPTVEGVTAFSKHIDFSDYDPQEDGSIVPPRKPGFGLVLA